MIRVKMLMFMALIIMMISSSLITNQTLAVASEAEFVDTADSYAQKEITALAKTGVISGYGQGKFAPTQPMTRAELAKIIVLTSGMKEADSSEVSFSDVPAESWYSGYVGALVKAGITQGTSDSTFSPDDKVTREQLVLFFIRAMGLEQIANVIQFEKTFEDWNEISDWANSSVALSLKIGFVQGMDSGEDHIRFMPKAYAERQALARLAYEYSVNKQAMIAAAQALLPKKQDDPVSPTPTPPACCFGGGGGGGAVVPPPPSLPINAVGTIDGDYSITAPGGYGPANGTGMAQVTGTLKVNPGANATVKLSNIRASRIEILSGSSHTIELSNVTADIVTVNAPGQASSIRVLVNSGSVIRNMDVKSNAIIETEGTGDSGPINVAPEAKGQNVVLRGLFTHGITSSATGGQLTIERNASGKSNVSQILVKSDCKIVLQEGATVQGLVIGAVVSLEGNQNAVVNTGLEVDEGGSLHVPDTIVAALREKLVKKLNEVLLAVTNPVEYTVEYEQTLASIHRMLKAAYDLGARPEEFPNLVKLQDANSILNELAVRQAIDSLQVIFQQGDSYSSVTKNIIFPQTGLLGTTVKWITNGSTFVKEDGVISRPTNGSDVTQRITAKVTRQGELTLFKTFTLQITAMPVDSPLITETPSVSTVVYADAAWISGTSASKETITVRDQNGQVLGEAVSTPNVSYAHDFVFPSEENRWLFNVPLNRNLTGHEQLSITARALDMQQSVPKVVTVYPTETSEIVSNKPSVQGEIYADNPILTIGINETTVVLVKDDKGRTLESKFIRVDSVPNYSFMMLEGTYEAGQIIRISAKSNGHKESGAVSLIVKGISGQTEAPIVNGKVYHGLSRIQIKVEKGAEIDFPGVDKESYFREMSYSLDERYDIFNYGLYLSETKENLEISAKVPGKIESRTTVELTPFTDEESIPPFVSKRVENGMLNLLVPMGSKIIVRDQSGHQIINSYARNIFGNSSGNGLQEVGFLKTVFPTAETIYISTQQEGKQESDRIPFVVEANPSSDKLSNASSSSIPSNNVVIDAPIILKDDIYPTGGILQLKTAGVFENYAILTKDGRRLAIGWPYTNDQVYTLDWGLEAGLSPGDQLLIRKEYFNQSSAPVLVTVKAPMQADVKLTAFQENISSLYVVSGTSVPNSTIEIKRVSDGYLLASTKASDQGYYTTIVQSGELTNLIKGDELEVISTHYAYGSQFVKLPINFIGVTSSPQMDESAMSVNGGFVRGIAAAGSIISLKDKHSNMISRGYADSQGRFEIMVDLDDLRRASSELWITAMESNKFASKPVRLLLQDYAGASSSPQINPNVILTDEMTMLYGTSDPYAIVYAVDDTNRILGLSRASYDGGYSIDFVQRPLVGKLGVYSISYGKRLSPAAMVNITSSPQTPIPQISQPVTQETTDIQPYLDTTQMFPTFILTDEQGYFMSNNLSSLGFPVHSLTEGMKLKLFGKVNGNKLSAPALITVTKAEQTIKPTVKGTVYNLQDQKLEVDAEVGSTVTARREDGTYLSSGISLVYISQALNVGDKIYVTAKANNKKESEPVIIIVADAPTTASPTVMGTVYSEDRDIRGSAEKDARVELRRQNGELVGVTTAYDGNYNLYFGDKSLQINESLLITAVSRNKKPSVPTLVVVTPSPMTLKPTVTTAVYELSRNITGMAEEDAYIYLRNSEGLLLGYSSTYAGRFNLGFSAEELHEHDLLFLTAKKTGQRESEAVVIQVMATPATATPTVTSVVYDNGGYFYGKAAANANIYVYSGDGTQIYRSSVNGEGTFSDVIYKDFKSGEKISITVKEYDKRESEPVHVIVQASGTEQTAKPVVSWKYSTNNNGGIEWSVKTEPFTKVTLTKPTGEISVLYADNKGDAWISYYSVYSPPSGQWKFVSSIFGKTLSETVIVTVP